MFLNLDVIILLHFHGSNPPIHRETSVDSLIDCSVNWLGNAIKCCAVIAFCLCFESYKALLNLQKHNKYGNNIIFGVYQEVNGFKLPKIEFYKSFELRF